MTRESVSVMVSPSPVAEQQLPASGPSPEPAPVPAFAFARAFASALVFALAPAIDFAMPPMTRDSAPYFAPPSTAAHVMPQRRAPWTQPAPVSARQSRRP